MGAKSSQITTLMESNITHKIYTLRGVQVMLDHDLADLYGVETRSFNQAVKRNVTRFPERFRFQLTNEEFENLRSQFVTSSWGGRRYLPYVFTEQGVAMLSAVLKSDQAVKTSIQIMDAFIHMRKLITDNSLIIQRMDRLEQKQIMTDSKIEKVLVAIEDKSVGPKSGIFFDGQVFDAYVFIANLIKRAKKSIVLIDNYVDESVLTLLTKRPKPCVATIYTKNISKKLQLDLDKHNEQYEPIDIKILGESHDRFLIIDKDDVYHIGASLKDLGKKWFAFSKLDKSSVLEIIKKLEKY